MRSRINSAIASRQSEQNSTCTSSCAVRRSIPPATFDTRSALTWPVMARDGTRPYFNVSRPRRTQRPFFGWSCIPQRSRSTFSNRIAVFLRYLQQFLLQAVGSFQIHAFFCVAARNQTPKVPQCPHTEIDDFNGKQGRGKDGVSDSNRFVDVHFLSLFFIVSSFGTGAPNTRVPRTLSAK